MKLTPELRSQFPEAARFHDLIEIEQTAKYLLQVIIETKAKFTPSVKVAVDDLLEAVKNAGETLE